MSGCRCGYFCSCSQRMVPCLDCGGRGWNYRWGCYGTQAVACANCDGSGCIPVRPAIRHRVHYPVPYYVPAPRYRLRPLARVI